MKVNPFSNESHESPPPDNADGGADPACAEVVALIPAYSLGATDPEEAALIRAQLATCPQAAHELAVYERLAMAMLYHTPPLSPSARVENQLRRAIGQPLDRQLLLPLTRTPVLRANTHTRWRWSITGLAAAMTIILILAGLNVYWIGQNLELRTAYQQLAAQQQTETDQENGVYVLLASEERQSIELPAAQENSGANAEILWDPDVNVAMLYAKSFPQLAPNQVYQLWLTTNGERQSGGLFTVNQSGTGVLIFPMSKPLDALDSMGITPEPAGGSPGPTAPAVVRRRLRET